MITIQGKSINIKEQIICRVVSALSKYPPSPSNFLHIDNFSDINDSYKGFILNSNQTTNGASRPIFQYASDTLSLKDGDVLCVNPNNQAIKIYDPASLTNSIFLTERCNSNCIMCPQPPKKQDSLNWLNLSLKSITLMDGATECLGITGGEPTIEWDSLIKVFKACKEFLPNTQIQLLTNARALTDFSKAKELAGFNDKLFVGVPIYADIDSIHDKLSGSKGAFWDTIEGLYNLERAGIFIELRIVITKMNYKRLMNFSEFVYRTLPFIGYVAFMAMEPIGKALKNIDKLWLDPMDYMDELEKAVKILWRRGIGVSLFNHQLCILPRNLWPLAKKAISDWKVVYSEECTKCTEQHNCGGFFFSSLPLKSRGVAPIL